MEFLKQRELLFCFFIFICKAIEVSLFSVKSMMLAKGRKKVTILLAFIEVLLWAFVISGIISSLSTNIPWLLAYCFGYTLGYYLGFMIESKLAFGTTNVCFIISPLDTDAVEEFLINNNHGYYVSECRGKNGKNYKFDTILPRRYAKQIRQEIEELCTEEIFVTHYDVSYVKGGYGVERLQR
ncbi:MAG: DUF5698 domain-containing protein [Lachnospiraceae bacterium]|jgi:uncharacterized protein YebE (UPF0316 family)